MAIVFGSNGSDLIHVAGDGYVAGSGVTDNPGATNSDDTIYSGVGGSDEIHAGGGNDEIHFGADLDSSDVIDGGSGFNTLVLDDQVQVTFGANSLKNIDKILLPALSLQVGFAGLQSLTMNDGNVAAGQQLVVDGSSLNSDTFFTFDGHAETDGTFWVYGGHGNDNITGGRGNDIFDLTTGGSDTVISGGGLDTFEFGNALTSTDTVVGDAVHGGILMIDGSAYAAGLVLAATTISNISQLYLGSTTGNFNYVIVTNDANVAAGKTLTIDASSLAPTGFSNTLTFDGSGETDGRFHVIGGGGADTITGGGGSDVFDLFSVHSSGILQFYTIGGGADVVHGLGGNDVFKGFTQDMTIDGGSGFDTAYASGDGIFVSDVIYGATSMTSIERLVVQNGVNVTMNDGNVVAGATLQIQGGINAANFDGSAETDGHYNMFGLYQGTWKGGALADTFTADGTLHCNLFGNGGNDTFKLIGGFGLSQVIDGGAGTDTLVLAADLSAGVAISAAMLTSVEILRCLDGHSYKLSTADGVVASGQLLTVDGQLLSASQTLSFDGSAETDGRFKLFGGAGGDTLTGGAGNDLVTGGLGADALAGGSGHDTFDYNTIADTGITASTRDRITGFEHGIDKIDLSTIDAIAGGGTSNDTFTYVGTGAFTAAGQVRVMDVTGGVLVLISTDADAAAEATIFLKGITTANIGAGDFVL